MGKFSYVWQEQCTMLSPYPFSVYFLDNPRLYIYKYIYNKYVYVYTIFDADKVSVFPVPCIVLVSVTATECL